MTRIQRGKKTKQTVDRLSRTERFLAFKNISYNWDLLVFGPEFAMLRTPRPVWDRFGRNSSLKGFPQRDSPPENGGRKRHKETKTERET